MNFNILLAFFTNQFNSDIRKLLSLEKLTDKLIIN